MYQVNYIYNDSPIIGFREGIGNPNLKWERTAQFDIGLDASFGNFLDIVIDYYKRNTTDLLFNVPIPTTSGYSSMLQNIGEVQNQGIEFMVNARVIDRAFKWDISFNASRNRNEVVDLYGDVESIYLGAEQGIARYLIVGEPVNGVWARESAGIIKTQEELNAYKEIRPNAQLGEEMYVDHNDDNSISNNDYIKIGTTEPEFFYGISTKLQYKNLALDIYSQGATGIASTATDYLLYGENQVQNRNYIPSKYAFDRMWREDNPDGTFPRPGAKGGELSDRSNGNRSYFIVKNIKLSYSLKSSLLQNVNWVRDVTIFTNAQNYLSFANFRGYNPEHGDTYYENPLAKALIFGINVKF